MKKQMRVLLYGETLVLAGVRASLEASQSFEVIAVNAGQANEQELLHLCPDAIIFDTEAVQPEFHLTLIQQCSEMLLIGIDPDRSNVFLLSGQQLHELSVKALVEVIQQSGGFRERER